LTNVGMMVLIVLYWLYGTRSL